MAGSFWTANIPVQRARPTTKTRAVSAPSTPADLLTTEALNQAQQRLAAFSLAPDQNLAALLQREQGLLHRPDGGTLSRHDLPSFDPNLPRGATPQAGGTKSRLEEYDANLARSGGEGGGGGIGIPAMESALGIRTDPQVLVQRIVDLEAELLQAQQGLAHYQAENAHLNEMLALAQAAAGGVGMGQGGVDPLMQMKIDQAVQARLLAQSQGHGMNWRSGASNGSLGSSGGLSQGHGISPLQRGHGYRYSPNTYGQPGVFGANTMFNQ